MSPDFDDHEISTDRAVLLARWFCQELPTRLLVIDLVDEQVIAADKSIQFQAVLDGYCLPCLLSGFLTDSAIAKVRAEQSCEWNTSPFLGPSLATLGGGVWKFENIARGGLGVLYQRAKGHFDDSCDPARNSAKDELTGLGARQMLAQLLNESLARFQSTRVSFAIYFLDVDHFKKINDRYGHLAGDEVLRCVAERILHAIRPGDGAIRFGGDEIVLVIGGLHSPEEAAAVGRRLASVIPREVAYNELQFSFTISMGVAFYTPRDDSAQAVLERADRAMYRAKSRGRCGEIEMD